MQLKILRNRWREETDGPAPRYTIAYRGKTDDATVDLSMQYVSPRFFPAEEEVVAAAFELITLGCVVLKIDGDDGFRMSRQDVARAYLRRTTTRAPISVKCLNCKQDRPLAYTIQGIANLLLKSREIQAECTPCNMEWTLPKNDKSAVIQWFEREPI